MANESIGLSRLETLAAFLEALPPGRFDYGHWVGEDWKGKPDLSCGTTACAFGWTTAIPAFREAGLHLAYNEDTDVKAILFSGQILPENDWAANTLTFSNAARFFEVTDDEAIFLFRPFEQHDDYDWFSPLSSASASDVAWHIRKFVTTKKERG